MNYTELVNESRRLVKATEISYPISEVNDSINRALDKTVALIRQSEGRWQWQDTNDSSAPYASTTSITTGTNQIVIDPTYQRIQRVAIKAPNATSFTKLIPFDIADPKCLDMYNTGITGIPTHYDKMGKYIILYPTPNYTQANSLQVFYEQGPSYFTVSDTTKTPGIEPMFVRLLTLNAAFDYAFINQLPIAKSLRDEIVLMENKLQDFYAHRDKDDSPKLSVKVQSFK